MGSSVYGSYQVLLSPLQAGVFVMKLPDMIYSLRGGMVGWREISSLQEVFLAIEVGLNMIQVATTK